jgi:hypothetical protein
VHSKRLTAYIVGAGLLAVAGAMLLFAMMPKSLSVHANTLLDAALEGDSRALLAYSLPEEKNRLGLDEQKVRQLWGRLILPRLANFELVGGSRQAEVYAGHQGHAGISLRTSDGRIFGFGASPWASDEGAGCKLMDFLVISWYLDYMREDGRDASEQKPGDLSRACISGLNKDLPTLQELGIDGMVKGSKVVTWAKLREDWASRLVH